MTEKIVKATKPTKSATSAKPVKVEKQSPATVARAKNPKITKILTETSLPVTDNIDKNLIPKVADYASSFNWWLDATTNENWAYAHNIFTPEEFENLPNRYPQRGGGGGKFNKVDN